MQTNYTELAKTFVTYDDNGQTKPMDYSDNTSRLLCALTYAVIGLTQAVQAQTEAQLRRPLGPQG